MKRLLFLFPLLSSVAAPAAHATVPVTLQGSPASMVRQSEVARSAGYPHAESPEALRALEREGALVRLTGDANYTFREGMRSGVARPELRLFVERLAAQYHEATGERLVVTSLTRPKSHQPGNAHALSVHPAGIAVDLRVSRQQASRAWLERVLLSLERQGLLDVTRERYPPHYHVALFPEPYLAHVERLIGPEALAAALAAERPATQEQRLDRHRPAPAEPAGVVPMGVEAPRRRGWAALWLLPAGAFTVYAVRRQRRSRERL